MNFLSDYLGYFLIKAVAGLVCRLPEKWARGLGRGIGRMGFYLKGERRRVAYRNLKATLGAEQYDIKRIVRESFENLGINLVEMLRFPLLSSDNIDELVKVEGIEILAQAKGVILLGSHFANWELSGFAFGLKGYPLTVLAREQKHPRLNRLLNEYRQLGGSRIVFKGMNARQIIRSVRRGEIVGILLDQNAGTEGMMIDFLGRPASTAAGIIQLGLRADVLLCPIFIWREQDGGGHYRIRIDAPLKADPEISDEENVRNCLAEYHRRLEALIRQYPEQWLWVHKRWKMTPKRKVLILSDGKVGHLRQSEALASLLEKESGGGRFSVETIKVKYRNRIIKSLLSLTAFSSSPRCQGCLACLKYALVRESFELLKNSFADIIISCGSSLSPVNLILSHENGAKSCVVMKPGAFSLKRFDLAIIPEHDRPHRWGNIVLTSGSLNLIRREDMEEAAFRLRDKLKLGGGLKIGLLVGGDTRHLYLPKDMLAKALTQLLEAGRHLGAEILITTSRRTPPVIEKFIETRLKDEERVKHLVLANRANPPETVAAILGLSRILVVTAESISMVTEAVSSQKWVIALPLRDKSGHRSRRHEQFLANLARRGALKITEVGNLAATIEELAREARVPPAPLCDETRIREALREKILR